MPHHTNRENVGWPRNDFEVGGGGLTSPGARFVGRS